RLPVAPPRPLGHDRAVDGRTLPPRSRRTRGEPVPGGGPVLRRLVASARRDGAAGGGSRRRPPGTSGLPRRPRCGCRMEAVRRDGAVGCPHCGSQLARDRARRPRRSPLPRRVVGAGVSRGGERHAPGGQRRSAGTRSPLGHRHRRGLPAAAPRVLGDHGLPRLGGLRSGDHVVERDRLLTSGHSVRIRCPTRAKPEEKATKSDAIRRRVIASGPRHRVEEVGLKIALTINGREVSADVEPRTLLVHFLRENQGLTGTHIGCETSYCGACTVLVDGRTVKSCTMFAVQADGASITTVEGLADNGQLHPVQEGFWERHGLQCGYCTPGMIMSAVGLLDANQSPSEDEIRHAIEGNLCRCTGYHNIVRAIEYAAAKMRGEEPPPPDWEEEVSV